MKKIIFAVMAAMMLALAGCSAPTAEDVVKKSSEGKEITEKDYGVIIEYAKKPIEEFSAEVDKEGNDAEKLMASAEAVQKKYPQFGEVLAILYEGFTQDKLKGEQKKEAAEIVRSMDNLMARLQSRLIQGMPAAEASSGATDQAEAPAEGAADTSAAR